MKKITSKEPISFRVDGNTVLDIDSKGCLATDEAAALAFSRLGSQIVVSDTNVKEAIKEEASADDAEVADENVDDESADDATSAKGKRGKK